MLYILNMAETRRLSGFPFKICNIGTAREHLQKPEAFNYSSRIELCLRLASNAELAEDFIDGQRLLTSFPHLIVKRPGLKHSFAAQVPRDAFFFSYDPELIPQLESARLLPACPIQKFELTPQINALLRQTASLLPHSQEHGAADRLDIACFQILEELLIAREKEKPGQDASQDKTMQISSHLKLHFASEIDFGQIAKSHGLSRRTFFRLWARHFDVSPAEYVLGLKMEEAQRLLSDTSRSVGAISLSLNFKEPSYFCSAFRKRFGMTPRQFRLKANAEPEL